MISADTKFTEFLLKYIEPENKGIFIECGANNGIAGSPCYKLEIRYNWTGVNIEGNPYCFEELVKSRPKCINVQAALNNYNGDVEFTLPTDGPRRQYAGQSSIVHREGYWKRDGEDRPVEKYTVPCITYDSLLEKLKIPYIDLFILDVEGAELLVLEGLTKEPIPKFLCVEDNQIDIEKLQSHLRRLNYKYINRYQNNSLYRRV